MRFSSTDIAGAVLVVMLITAGAWTYARVAPVVARFTGAATASDRGRPAAVRKPRREVILDELARDLEEGERLRNVAAEDL